MLNSACLWIIAWLAIKQKSETFVITRSPTCWKLAPCSSFFLKQAKQRNKSKFVLVLPLHEL